MSVPESLKGCAGSEVQQYYELIGKYDQFVPGWKDVTDRYLRPVQPVEVDSTENFLSLVRLAYVETCLTDD